VLSAGRGMLLPDRAVQLDKQNACAAIVDINQLGEQHLKNFDCLNKSQLIPPSLSPEREIHETHL
jgi:hypothetical protein